MLSLRVNRKAYNVDVEAESPLLWVIRDTIGLTGTKSDAADRFVGRAPCMGMENRFDPASCTGNNVAGKPFPPSFVFRSKR